MPLALRWTALIGVLLASALRAGAEPLDEALYARLLESHTRAVDETVGTRVDYAGLAGSADWRRLVQNLLRSRPEQLDRREEQLAFWINAYNILAIDLVARNLPLKSIRDIGSFFDPVWDREAGRIGGRAVSLGHIEHEILRPMGEPRIHVAIVCASTSCPSLRREPYSADRLEEQLADSARRFLASDTKGLRAEANAVRISRIFDWFEEDFEASGGLLAFLRRYAPASARAALAGDPRIRHFDYDWTLNALAKS